MKFIIALFGLTHICFGNEPTSSSDRPSYLSVCAQAAVDDALFSTFKAHPEYRKVLEHVTERQGEEYLAIITAEYGDLLSYWDAFATNDLIGSPMMAFYPPVGTCSPTTLRYIKVAGDFRAAFGDLDGKCIVEIGGGYGGQCKILSDIFSFQEYAIIDLPSPLALIDKYLSILGVPQYTLTPPDEVEPRAGALIISNFAFSECSRSIQDFYFEQVIRPSDGGYITWNNYTSVSWLQPYSLGEIVGRLEKYGFSVEVTIERPLGHPDNRVIIWRR